MAHSVCIVTLLLNVDLKGQCPDNVVAAILSVKCSGSHDKFTCKHFLEAPYIPNASNEI